MTCTCEPTGDKYGTCIRDQDCSMHGTAVIESCAHEEENIVPDVGCMVCTLCGAAENPHTGEWVPSIHHNAKRAPRGPQNDVEVREDTDGAQEETSTMTTTLMCECAGPPDVDDSCPIHGSKNRCV